MIKFFFFFSSRRRHTRCGRDWSSDVCSSDLGVADGDAGNVGDGVERAGSAVKRNAEIAGARLGRRIFLSRGSSDCRQQTEKKGEGVDALETDHKLFFQRRSPRTAIVKGFFEI